MRPEAGSKLRDHFTALIISTSLDIPIVVLAAQDNLNFKAKEKTHALPDCCFCIQAERWM